MVAAPSETVPRLGKVRLADALDEAQLGEAARVHQILNQKVSYLVHILMKYEVMLFGDGAAPSDRAADLADEDGLTQIPKRGDPKADPMWRRTGLTDPSSDDIGPSVEQPLCVVDRAAIAPQAAPNHGCSYVIELADQDDIERIAVFGALCVRGAAWQAFQGRPEGFGLIELHLDRLSVAHYRL